MAGYSNIIVNGYLLEMIYIILTLQLQQPFHQEL